MSTMPASRRAGRRVPRRTPRPRTVTDTPTHVDVAGGVGVALLRPAPTRHVRVPGRRSDRPPSEAPITIPTARSSGSTS